MMTDLPDARVNSVWSTVTNIGSFLLKQQFVAQWHSLLSAQVRSWSRSNGKTCTEGQVLRGRKPAHRTPCSTGAGGVPFGDRHPVPLRLQRRP